MNNAPMIDRIDAGFDLLLVAEIALSAHAMHDKEAITAIRGTIEQALKILAPVRQHANLAA